MSLISDIKDIVKDISPESTFRFSSYFKANVKGHSLKKENLPYIIFDNELVKDVEIMKNANLKKDTRIKLYFLDMDNPKNDDEEREAIRLDMEAIADRVMVRIFQLSYVQTVGTTNPTYTTDPVFNAFSGDFSGVVCTMRTKIQETVKWC